MYLYKVQYKMNKGLIMMSWYIRKYTMMLRRGQKENEYQTVLVSICHLEQQVYIRGDKDLNAQIKKQSY